MDSFEVYGFKEDYDLFLFKNIFDNKNIREVHIDTYMNDPYILFSRMVEKNIASLMQDNRLILQRNNGGRLSIMDVPINNIFECMVKMYSSTQYQLVFAVENIWYKILVLI